MSLKPTTLTHTDLLDLRLRVQQMLDPFDNVLAVADRSGMHELISAYAEGREMHGLSGEFDRQARETFRNPAHGGARGDPVHGGRYVLFRDQTTQSAAAGGALAGNARPSYVTGLFALSACAKAGANFMQGPVGGQPFPALASISGGGWVDTEDTAPDSVEMTFGLAVAEPRQLVLVVDVTDRLLKTAPAASSMMIEAVFQKQAAALLDAAALAGPGTGGAPTGIALTTGVGTFDPSSCAWSDLVAAEQDVRAATGAEGEPIAFVTTSSVAATLKGRVRETGQARYLAEPLPQGGGWGVGPNPLLESENCPSNTIIAGDFRTLTIVVWNALEVTIGPAKATGLRRVTGYVDVDIVVPMPTAFTVGTGAT